MTSRAIIDVAVTAPAWTKRLRTPAAIARKAALAALSAAGPKRAVEVSIALTTDAVAAEFRSKGIRYMKGDWTRRDPKITKILTNYGRSGVPLYLYFAPGRAQAVVLPQLLTPDIVLDAIGQAEG